MLGTWLTVASNSWNWTTTCSHVWLGAPVRLRQIERSCLSTGYHCHTSWPGGHWITMQFLCIQSHSHQRCNQKTQRVWVHHDVSNINETDETVIFADLQGKLPGCNPVWAITTITTHGACLNVLENSAIFDPRGQKRWGSHKRWSSWSTEIHFTEAIRWADQKIKRQWLASMKMMTAALSDVWILQLSFRCHWSEAQG